MYVRLLAHSTSVSSTQNCQMQTSLFGKEWGGRQFAEMPMVDDGIGGRAKIVNICQRLKWMVP